MKKKFLLIVSAVLTAALIAGCSGNGSQSSEASKKESKASAASAVSETSKSDDSKTDSDESKESKKESKEESKKESSAENTGDLADPSWFDDAVFIGDSVTLKLSYFVEDHDDLGKAEFLCAGSLGYTNALWDLDHEDNVHPTLNGEKITVDDGAKALGSKKIFIMLGMNDIGLYGVDGAVSSMIELTDKIHEKCPDAVIYIESVTPMVANSSLGGLNNETIKEFDEKIQPICEEKGYKYLDVASAVSDENGDLIYEYCGDPPTDDNPDGMGLHFTDAGCQKWADYLRANVK